VAKPLGTRAAAITVSLLTRGVSVTS